MNEGERHLIDLSGDFSGKGKDILFEQYKVYADITSKVSDRRSSTHTLLLSANTGLVTVYALIAGKDRFSSSDPGPWQWLLPLAGMAICFSWFALMRAYRSLNKAKFSVLSEFEQHLPARMFDREGEYLNVERSRGNFRFTFIEQVLPLVFGALYLAILMRSISV